MARRSCPVCHLATVKKSHTARAPEDLAAKSWPLIECAGCGLAYIPECPPPAALYTPTYYGQKSGFSNWIFEPFNQWWVRRKARRLMAIGEGFRWLDYGCGRGDLLSALKEEGADIWGIESQKDCADLLSKRWPGRMATSLEELNAPQDGWNGIALYHVLEHLEDPSKTLTHLRRLAAPHGVLFLAIPYWGSLERRLFGDRWFHFDAPRHVQHFSPDNLQRLLAQSDWTLKRVEFKLTAYDLFGFFQTLLNVGPGPRNYFYRWLKRSEMIQDSSGWRLLGAIWNVVALVPAALLTVLVVPVLVVVKRTGTFEVVACAKTISPS